MCVCVCVWLGGGGGNLPIVSLFPFSECRKCPNMGRVLKLPPDIRHNIVAGHLGYELRGCACE